MEIELWTLNYQELSLDVYNRDDIVWIVIKGTLKKLYIIWDIERLVKMIPKDVKRIPKMSHFIDII